LLPLPSTILYTKQNHKILAGSLGQNSSEEDWLFFFSMNKEEEEEEEE
jgi:hypothetical protein